MKVTIAHTTTTMLPAFAAIPTFTVTSANLKMKEMVIGKIYQKSYQQPQQDKKLNTKKIN